VYLKVKRCKYPYTPDYIVFFFKSISLFTVHKKTKKTLIPLLISPIVYGLGGRNCKFNVTSYCKSTVWIPFLFSYFQAINHFFLFIYSSSVFLHIRYTLFLIIFIFAIFNIYCKYSLSFYMTLQNDFAGRFDDSKCTYIEKCVQTNFNVNKFNKFVRRKNNLVYQIAFTLPFDGF
jgi:hypothetical protein